jgi:AcrR family transcriptional regulator
MRDYDGKTAAERVAERRARLVDAGIELFGEHGYAGTSIRAVLRQAGLRDRYFGESFADLDALLAAAYGQLIDEELAACRAAIGATTGPSEGARAMIDAISRLLEDNPGHARIKLREVFSGVVAAADAYLLAWLDGELGVSRQGVVDLVTRLFDSVAAGIAISPSR